MILNILKIGGAVVDNENLLDGFIEKLHSMDGRKLIVHGGGKTASKICNQLGITPKMYEGRRITDSETLKVVVMTYAGWINKTVVARLQAAGFNAAGLTGSDGNTIEAHKRMNAEIDYGFAGDIDEINPKFLSLLIQNEFVPVVAPITHDGQGQLLNTNADTIAASLAGSLSSDFEVRLIYLFDHPGVMRDIGDPTSVMDEVNLSSMDDLRESGIIADGMIPKLHNAESALRKGVKEVYLTNVESLSGLGEGKGTKVIVN